MQVVFDAGPLITACKFEAEGELVIDHLLRVCKIAIPPAVEEEVAILGAKYPDGVVAGERIADGEIRVLNVTTRQWEQKLNEYSMGDGERDSIELCNQETDVDALITDDQLAFVVATRLGLRVWMLPDLVVELVRQRTLTASLARAILEVIRPRYRVGVIEHCLENLQEVENAESRGSG